MEETKIWVIEDNGSPYARALEATEQTKSEKLLEDVLVENPEMLEIGLQLVGRQTRTADGWLDLLGIDVSGRLVVFELKREKLNRDAVAQIIDYASYLNSLDLSTVTNYIAERSGTGGIKEIENFEEWYNNEGPGENLESLTPPRMVLVGLGADDVTERMVNYLVEGGMDISLLTFYGFEHEGKTLLARHVEVGVPDESNNTGHRRRPRGMTNAEMRNIFEKRVAELEVSGLLDAVTNMILENSNNPVVSVSTSQRTFRFKPGGKVYFYIELGEKNKGVNLGFNPVAINRVPGEFKKLNHNDITFKEEKARNKNTFGEFDYEVKFPILHNKDWDNHKDKLTALTQAVYEAYQKNPSD